MTTSPRVRILAPTGWEAEQRVLAVMDYDYEDDLRGATASANLLNVQQWLEGQPNTSWRVDVVLRLT
jgi:hypothetical protein